MRKIEAISLFDLPGSPRLPELPGFVLESFNMLIRSGWDGRQAIVDYLEVQGLITEGARTEGVKMSPSWLDSVNIAPHYTAKSFRTVGYYEDGKGDQRTTGYRYYIFKK